MKKILQTISILLLFGCAQQVAPTGGPKDETPPKVLDEIPPNLSTNFIGKQIEIPFDEFIQLRSASEQVVISPPMLKTPTFQLKRKSLIVKFEQELAENTTYTINFGEAIVDNNEGNILKNYTYVFSTGAYLDSMQVKGKLTGVLTGEPEKNALVMLYKNDVDSLPLDTIPDYFTRTDESGNYHIKNVADQRYKVFALVDENANYKFDVPTEKIGFLDTLITPFNIPTKATPDSTVSDSLVADTSSNNLLEIRQSGNLIPSYDMIMFVEEDTTQFLKKSYCDQFGKLMFVYNRPVSGFELAINGVSNKKQWKLQELSKTADTVTVWITDQVPDTMKCLINVEGLNTDTVELVMKSITDSKKSQVSIKGKGRKKESFGFKLGFSPTKNRSPKPGQPIKIVSNHPVLGFNITRLKLYEDSTRVIYDIGSNDPALRIFDISYDWKPGAHYRLLALDSAFIDMYGLWNDSTETAFIATDKDDFGTLTLKVLDAPESNIIVELISSNETLIDRRSVDKKGTVEFKMLEPSTYNVDIVSDLNANGKWDSGRYSEKLQPEPISRIKAGAEVRANWDFEIEWSPKSTQP
jgi:hypothetical protein